MVQVISEYLKKCDQCQRGKRLPSKLSPGLGKTSSLEKKPLQCWSIDVIFMPKGLNQLKFILTMVDISTQWIEAFPMRSNNAKTVAPLNPILHGIKSACSKYVRFLYPFSMAPFFS